MYINEILTGVPAGKKLRKKVKEAYTADANILNPVQHWVQETANWRDETSHEDLTEFGDVTRIAVGTTVNHSLVGNAKVVAIRGNVAEIVDRFGKHVKVNLSSLRLGELVDENAESLSVGDEVVITGNVEFSGAKGVIDNFGHENRFVIVNLYDHGKHSFHSSDVSQDDFADSEDADHDYYNGLDDEQLDEISDDLRNRYVQQATAQHGHANMGRRNTQPSTDGNHERFAHQEKMRNKGLGRALSDKRLGRSGPSQQELNELSKETLSKAKDMVQSPERFKRATLFQLRRDAEAMPKINQRLKQGTGVFKQQSVAEGSTTRGGFGGSADQAHHEIEWTKNKIEKLKPLLIKKPSVARQIKDLERQIRERELSIAYQKEGVAEGVNAPKMPSVKQSVTRYIPKAMHDTISGKKDRNKGMQKAFARVAGNAENMPLIPKQDMKIGESLMAEFIKSLK